MLKKITTLITLATLQSGCMKLILATGVATGVAIALHH